MIEKLYNLKKTQVDQRISQQGAIQGRINTLDEDIEDTKKSMYSATVTKNGAISDFTILQMHKNSMKLHISKLEKQKEQLIVQLDKIKLIIVELQKETEQFGYILKEEKKLELKRILSAEEQASTEYVQSKFISRSNSV